MAQCIAKVKSGRQCRKLAEKGKRFCSLHRDNIDWQRTLTTVGGAAVGNLLAPGIGGMLIGAFVGNVTDRFIEENKPVTKRVFVSFDFDNDKSLKDLLVGQSRNPDSPFSISDWSLKEEQEEWNWKDKARQRIKRSEIVVVIAGTQTYMAPGVLAEVDMAREEEIKVVQIKGHSDKTCPSVPNAGQKFTWTWENLKSLLR